MKYIKTYEDTKPIYGIGTYVICDEKEGDNGVTKEFKKFLASNIGQITDNTHGEPCPYVVKYENIPDLFSVRFNEIMQDKDVEYDDRRAMTEDEIIYNSKNKKDLELYFFANKYNL